MNIADLEKFLIIAETENMQRAAEKLQTSASVLSKSVKRLELALSVPLFDRVGKHIQLNASGQALRQNAACIVGKLKETKALFTGLSNDQDYRIAGPSILLFKWASVLSRFILMQSAKVNLHFDCYYEQQALDRVINGLADLAIVTTAVLPFLPRDIYHREIGEIKMQVAAAGNHPLVKISQQQVLTLDDVLSFTFVTPDVSPYCGEARGIGCDGWNNQFYPRKLQIIANDYSVLTQLVRSGQALAYLPDYWLREHALHPLSIKNIPEQGSEKLLLVSWQQELINNFISE